MNALADIVAERLRRLPPAQQPFAQAPAAPPATGGNAAILTGLTGLLGGGAGTAAPHPSAAPVTADGHAVLQMFVSHLHAANERDRDLVRAGGNYSAIAQAMQMLHRH